MTLRVLHVRNSDLFGGPERLLLDQVVLASPDVVPSVASFGSADAPHPLLDRLVAEAEGVDTYLVGQSSSYDPRTPKRLKAVIRQTMPDVVVGHDYKADLVLALVARDRPRVAIVHGYTAEDAKIRLFETLDRRLLRSLDAVVVVSEALGDMLRAEGVPPERIHHVPNGVAVETVAAAAHAGREALRAEWGFGDEHVVLLVLGRLSPEKGQDVALDAFARMASQHPGAHLVLVGDGASRDGLEARVAVSGLEGRVHFPGWRDDPHACLGAADVLVLPSRREGLPLALLEAMAAGTPVVATDVGAVREALDDGACGLVVGPDDVGALAQATARLLDDPEAARQRARLAALRVRDVYGAEAQVRRLEAIYKAARN